MDQTNPNDTFLVGVLVGVVIVVCTITIYHIVKHEVNLFLAEKYKHRH